MATKPITRHQQAGFLFHVTLPSGATELHGAFGSSQENAYKKLAERFLDAKIVPYTKQKKRI
jgi:hypothetical protein